MFEPHSEQRDEPRFTPPISIVEIILAAIVLYLAYHIFLKEDPRFSHFHSETEVVAQVHR